MPARDFFATKSPQAVLKHGLLSRYAHYFAGRAGYATGGRIAFIDGYSGEGRYKDGSPGSPLLLASSAQRAETMNRDVKLALVEPDARIRRQLRASLRDALVDPDAILDQPLERVIDGLLNRYADRAVLLFVDPFGLAFSYQTLVEVLRRSCRESPIDVLFHFSALTVARMGQAAVRGTGAKQNSVHLDRALGGVDWRSAFADLPPIDGAATDAAVEVARRFSEAVAHDCGVPSLSVPVRRRPGHAPVFLLTLFSRDPVGKALWDFADMASKAHIAWLLRCEADEYSEYRAEQDNTPTLFDLRIEPTEADVERVIAERSAAYLSPHLRQLIQSRGTLRPQDDPAAVFGDMLGVAGEKHARAALRQLVNDGPISGDTTGTFRKNTFKWHGPRA
jgi:three-Cys-motif partner protein